MVFNDLHSFKLHTEVPIYFKDRNLSVEKKSPNNQSMLGSAKQLYNSSWQQHRKRSTRPRHLINKVTKKCEQFSVFGTQGQRVHKRVPYRWPLTAAAFLTSSSETVGSHSTSPWLWQPRFTILLCSKGDTELVVSQSPRKGHWDYFSQCGQSRVICMNQFSSRRQNTYHNQPQGWKDSLAFSETLVL